MGGLVLSSILLLANSALVQANPLEYFKDIRPILEEHCVACHSHALVENRSISGGLALDSYARLMQGSRPVVLPNSASTSLILLRLEAADPSIRMPKGGLPLSRESVEIIRKWIDSGAKEGLDPKVTTHVSGTETVSAAPATISATEIFIPYGGRPPIESATEMGKRGDSASGGLVDPPSAKRLVIEEEQPAERINAQPYVDGLTAKVGPLPPITALAFTPNATSLLVGFYGRFVVWDLAQSRVVREFDDMAGSVNGLAFSPDGKMLSLIGGKPFSRGEIRLYDAENFMLKRQLVAHQEVILAQAFSPDSKRLATASFDKTVEIWDVDNGKRLSHIGDHSDVVNCVAFDPEGRRLASAGMDRIAKLSNATTGDGILTISPEANGIMAVAFSPDGNFLLTTGESPEILWWDLAKIGESVSDFGWKPVRKISGHLDKVYDMHFSPDGKLIATCGADKTIRIWDGTTGLLARTLIDSDALLYSLAFSPDSKRIAAAGADGLTHVWDVEKGLLLVTLVQKPSGIRGRSSWIAVRPDKTWDVSAEWKAEVRQRVEQNAAK